MKIYNNVSELVGKTPLIEFKNYTTKNNIEAQIIAKLESFNPAGSAKDRIAKAMIEDAEKNGLLIKGSTIIEPTSGNTGIGLASIGVSKGYRVILTMPETMSIERQKLLKAFGAEVILTDGAKGMKGSIEKAEELKKEIPNSFIPGQFTNMINPKAHKETTGPEIWEDTDGQVDIFIAGIGTGGTISGTGEYLKEKNNKIKIIGVEPADSPLITKGEAGTHKLQGIGANFIPETFNKNICDEIITITTKQAYDAATTIAKEEGILIGISGGAAIAASTLIAKREENKNKKIVVLIPDTGERYLSTEMFN